jgi:hypothetical protein
MKKNVDQMKTPGFQAKEIIIDHIKNVHEGPVVIRDNWPCLETPNTLGEYRRYIPYIPDPWILQYLVHIVIHKIAGKGSEINRE